MFVWWLQCSFGGCSRNVTNFRTYQNHLLKHRRGCEVSDEEILEHDFAVTNDEAECQVNEIHLPTTREMQNFAAHWILKVRESRSLTRSAMQGIIEDVEDLIECVRRTLKEEADAILQRVGVDTKTRSELHKLF